MKTHETRDTETLGARILLDLARLQAAGSFFSYRQRIQLRRIDDREELRRTLAKWGFGWIDTSGSQRQIIDAVANSYSPKRNTLLFLIVLDVVFFGLPLFLFWIADNAKKRAVAKIVE